MTGHNNVDGSYELRYPEPDTSYGIPEIIEARLNHKDTFDAFIDRTREKTNMEFRSFALYAGNDKTYEVYVKDRALNPINLQGSTCVLTMKREKEDVTPVVQKSTVDPTQAQLGNVHNGQVWFYILPADTVSLEPRQYPFDIRVTVQNGKTYTVAEGVIMIKEPVN